MKQKISYFNRLLPGFRETLNTGAQELGLKDMSKIDELFALPVENIIQYFENVKRTGATADTMMVVLNTQFNIAGLSPATSGRLKRYLAAFLEGV